MVIRKMPKLKCHICGNEIEVPLCCEKSMIIKDTHLLCCCKSSSCGYQIIPECCGEIMRYEV
jgi:hypothetical protein